MKLEDFKKAIVWKDMWTAPIDFSKVDNVSVKDCIVHLVGTQHSSGIQPVLLSNAEKLAGLTGSDWIEIINLSGAMEDKFMMGTINLVDTLFKYFEVDIRPIINDGVNLDKSKSQFVVNYYADCKGCLSFDSESSKKVLSKYSVSKEAVAAIRQQIVSVGGQKIALP